MLLLRSLVRAGEALKVASIRYRYASCLFIAYNKEWYFMRMCKA